MNYSEWKETKVQFNYHVDCDGYFYSVHYSYVGQPCSVRATSKVIELYVAGERVAAHPRNYNPYKRYTTLAEHMPEGHKAVYGWSSERFLSWAEKIGTNTRELIKIILESREYPVQTYRACMGIMRLSKSHTPEVMENASQEALVKKTYSFKYFSIILKQVAKIPETQSEKTIKNDNVRGSSAYAGGGINA